MTGRASAPSLGAYFAGTLPPLDGRLRVLVMGLLLLLAQEDVFSRMSQRLATCPEGFYEAEGVMNWLGPDGQGEILAWAERLQTPMLVAWCAAVLGLFGRLSFLVTGVCLLLTQGWWRGCVGTGHSWYLPLYTILALGIAGGTDRFSLDALLSRRFAWYPFRVSAPDSLGATGLARSLVLLCVVFVMGSAGLSKLLDAGPAWMTGESLQQYIKTMPPPPAWGRWLSQLLQESRAAAGAASVFTFVIELGAPVLLFSKRIRFPYVVAAWGFHMGIMAVMVPRYGPQMVCYLLVVDWGRVFARFRYVPPADPSAEPRRKKKKKRKKAGDAVRAGFSPRVLRACAAIGLAVSAILLGTAIVRREYYPLSHIPMYSSRLSDELRGGIPIATWEDPLEFQRIARGFIDDHKPWVFQSYTGRRVSLMIRTQRGPQNVTGPLLERLLPGERTVWVKRSAWAVARDVTSVDLAPLKVSSDAQRAVYDLSRRAQPSHSDELLRLVVPTAKQLGLDRRGSELELVYVERGFLLVLARAALR